MDITPPKKFPGRRGLVMREPVIFERSTPGRQGFSLGRDEFDGVPLNGLDSHLREDAPVLPEVSEPEAIRHFLRLSQWNYSIDTGIYPLGSCTMKFNPRINEEVARLPGWFFSHPLAPPEVMQGALELMWNLERYLAEISGFEAVTLQPAAGAHGELTALMMIRACLRERGQGQRKRVLIPDSAHGTNPASCTLNGYEAVELKTGPEGYVTAAAVAAAMDDTIAAIMMTNPNTLGVFEREIAEISRIVHERGGLVYCDGANMNSLMGMARPGDMGVDAMHFNLHKTFSTPHGGGGPGSGPVGVSHTLVPYLPGPRIEKDSSGRFLLNTDLPRSIGRVKAFLGQFGMFVRAYAYIRELGPDGLKLATQMAVLNANYVRAKLRPVWNLAWEAPSMHEAVFNDTHLKPTGCTTMDVAKRLIDYGFHPPTVYFPLIAPGALMIEPTETESKETLDLFVDAMNSISKEAFESPQLLKNAPHQSPVRRLDEARAARNPILTWQMEKAAR
ncbi:MAG: putative glycine dehydrogenase (decarboxylating) subunit 2 [Myxococcota bacterium]|nr:putative glycine dehydrogenase (decarboxylating) subunit 2 [Myxococcota bacterium]